MQFIPMISTESLFYVRQCRCEQGLEMGKNNPINKRKRMITRHNTVTETDCAKQNTIIRPWLPCQPSLPVLEDSGLSWQRSKRPAVCLGYNHKKLKNCFRKHLKSSLFFRHTQVIASTFFFSFSFLHRQWLKLIQHYFTRIRKGLFALHDIKLNLSER